MKQQVILETTEIGYIVKLTNKPIEESQEKLCIVNYDAEGNVVGFEIILKD